MRHTRGQVLENRPLYIAKAHGIPFEGQAHEESTSNIVLVPPAERVLQQEATVKRKFSR
jgi:hypothetical protein